MSGIPENTSYGYTPYLNNMAGLASGVGQAIKQMKSSNKTVDTSKYQGVVNNVKKYASTSKSKLGVITTPYKGSTKFEASHPGIDIANKMGTDIPSFVTGKVVEAVSGKKQGDSGYGNYVVVKDSAGNLHRYSHLKDEYVSVGQDVTAGMAVGSMGNTGQTYSVSGGDGSHLDYRVRDLYGRYIDPNQFITE